VLLSELRPATFLIFHAPFAIEYKLDFAGERDGAQVEQ